MIRRKGSSDEGNGAEDSARTHELVASLPPDRLAADLPDLRRGSIPPPAAEPSAPEPVTVRDGAAAAARQRARSLGKYQFIATLGRGGMADVHLAVSTGPAGFSKLQVIKCLRPAMADEPEFRNMLLDEARLAARLNHRNVVQTNEVGQADGQYFLAMEYLDGQPLSRVISRARERERPIPLAISLFVLGEVLTGLHYAHELVDYDGTPLGVVHRDVSPHNIFVTYDGQVKVVDFGIALAARRAVETQTGTLKGKVAYMAPEQAFSPSSEIDRRADVFSVGVILWELVAGRRLWRGLNDPQIISRLLRDIPDVRTARPDVPPELARICSKALARSASERYSTAAELKGELTRYAERLDEQVTSAQLGELVSDLFADERAEIRAIIDRQLKSLQGSQETDTDWDFSGRRSSLPAIAPASEITAVSAASPSRPTLSQSQQPQGTLHAVVRAGESRGRSIGPLVAAGIGLAALGGAIALFVMRGPSEPAPAPAPASVPTGAAPVDTAPAAAPPPPVPLSPVAPSGAFIRARITASPAEAKILVDGSELPTNPFESKFVKDDAAHRIEVKATGFIPQSRMVVFDKDLELELTLQPLQGRLPPAVTTAIPGLPPPKPDPY
ncbi:MAG: serine/threonine protein kinase [Polyangiaceae bacterium]|nr:serine/threonine protein kinase [Polyangiaceae bacterium]